MYCVKLKKIKFLIALCGVPFLSLAGEHNFTQSVMPHQTYAGVYLEGNVGYATRDWASAVSLTQQNNVNWQNKSGGIIAGADIGYQFNRYVALEIGWEYLPTMWIKLNTFRTDYVESWVGYVGPKFMIPLFCRTYAFIKGGLSYLYNKNRPPLLSLSQLGGIKSNYWSGFAGIGLQHYVNRRVSVHVEAMYLPGRSVSAPSHNYFNVPQTYFYVGGIGYKFML